jgi:antitoxin PrlF
MHLHYHVIDAHFEAPMTAAFKHESTLTDRYQTTVPDAVRRALKLGKRDKIRYVLQPDGKVVITRAGADADDPALDAFLGFLASDLTKHPQRVSALDAGLRKRIRSLVGKIEVDLDAALPDEE